MKKHYTWFGLIGSICLMPGLLCAQAANAVATSASADSSAQSVMALIAVVVPMCVAAIKLYFPRLQKSYPHLFPIFAVAFGGGLTWIVNWLTNSHIPGITGVLLGAAGIGVREIYDQTKQLWPTTPPLATSATSATYGTITTALDQTVSTESTVPGYSITYHYATPTNSVTDAEKALPRYAGAPVVPPAAPVGSPAHLDLPVDLPTPAPSSGPLASIPELPVNTGGNPGSATNNPQLTRHNSMNKIARYGWIAQRPDPRDKKFVPKMMASAGVIDLRNSFMPPVYDQLQISSCVANGTAAVFDYERSRAGLPFLNPSRLFIYANARTLEGTPLSVDSGAQIRDGIKAVVNYGVCPETEWPYVEQQFSTEPPQTCYVAALKDLVLSYQAVAAQDIPAALAQGNPVVIGITCCESFESEAVANTGIVSMPGMNDSVVGGHCVVIVGMDSNAQTYTCRNSWGATWGQNGYFTIPAAYINNQDLASDFWIITKDE